MLGGIAQISDLPLPYEKKTVYYNLNFFDNIGYLDPNSFLNENFKKEYSMDIYSLGILLWEIMSEQIPYSKSRNSLQLVEKIKYGGAREQDISCAPYEYIDLYKKCWWG